jgi:hypothetical protein
VRIVHDFVSTTRPSSYSRARLRRLLEDGAEGLPPLAAVPDLEGTGA